MTAFEKLQTGLGALAESRRLTSHDQWTTAQLARYGHERLLALLTHARTHSPFYRDRLAGVRLGPDLELASLPTLDKATMLESFDELMTDRRLHLAELERHLTEAQGDPLYLGDYRIMATGGTTGRRGLFAYSRRDWREVIGGTIRWTTGFLGLAPRLPRRRRIAAIHNEIHKLIKPCEYVFLIEDDGALPPDALSRLLADYKAHPYAGFIEGVELGRWGSS